MKSVNVSQKKLLLPFAVILLSITHNSICVPIDDPFASTSYGRLRGYFAEDSHGQRSRIFKAVPFAAPPLGDLRWRLPQKPSPWAEERDATKYSAACLSSSSKTRSSQISVSEDCLYLNVFAGQRCTPQHRCPVIVYLHGGGLRYDSAVMFNDSYIIENFSSQDLVFVTPAFRVGFAGVANFGDPQLVPYNLAIYDIIESLRFLKKEVRSFGGDPTQLIPFGHSYGATLSMMISFSPPIASEFRFPRVVSMSPSIHTLPPSFNRLLTQQLAHRVNCSRATPSQTIACMRSKSGLELLSMQRTMEDETPDLISLSEVVLEPPLFPWKSVAEMFHDPAVPVDILTGTTAMELDNTDAPSRGRGNGVLVGVSNVNEIDEVLFAANQSGKINMTHLPGTQAMFLSVYLGARAMTNMGAKAYLYSFEMDKHNHHIDDLSYILGFRGFEHDDNEKIVAGFYPRLFTNFTKFGVPSPRWKPFDNRDSFYSIRVDEKTGEWPEMKTGFQKDTIDFWVHMAPQLDKLITAQKADGADPLANISVKAFEVAAEVEGESPSGVETESLSGEAEGRVPLFLFLIGLVVLAGAYLCCRNGDERNIAIRLHLIEGKKIAEEERIPLILQPMRDSDA